MTIQQHASFDSSAAELNATSKLVKAWESKNAKNAAKAGGVSMMALSLAACGGSSTTPEVTPVPPVSGDSTTALTISNTGGVYSVTNAASGVTLSSSAAATLYFDDATSDAYAFEMDAGSIGSGLVTFEFADANDVLTLAAKSDFGNVSQVVVKNGTVDFTAIAAADFKVSDVTLNSGAVMTTTQVLQITSLSGTGKLKVEVTTADDVSSLSTHFETLNVKFDVALTSTTLSTSDLSSSQATIDTATTGPAAAAADPVLLTADTDTLPGTSGDDTFKAVVVAKQATGSTLNAGDSISASEGTDTLEISVTGAISGGDYTISGLDADVETLMVNNQETSTDDNIIDTLLMDGLTTVGLSASAATGDTVFTNATTVANVVMNNGSGDLTVSFTDKAVEGTEDSISLAVTDQSAGTFLVKGATTGGVETVNVVASGTANSITVDGNNVTSVVNVSGSGPLTATLSSSALKTVNAADATGKLDLTTGVSGNLTITGGSADDKFTFTGSTYTKDDVVDGGDGDDTLEIDAVGSAADLKNVSNVETIEVLTTGGITIAEDVSVMNFDMTSTGTNALTLSAGVKSAVTAEIGATGADTVVNTADVTLTIDGLAAAFTDAGTITGGTTATDTLNITADTNSDAAILLSSSGVVTKVEQINVLDNGDNAISAAKGAAGKDVSITTGAYATALTIDASALDAAISDDDANDKINDSDESAEILTVDGSSATAALTITGGAAGDSITGGTKNDVIDGGAGNDTITMTAAGDDNVSGGAGDDTILFGNTLTKADVVDGGEGEDILSVTSLTAADLAGVTNVETLQYTGTTTLSADLSFDTIDLSKDTNADSVTFATGYTNATTVKVDQGDTVVNTGADIVLTVTGTAADFDATGSATTVTGSDKTGVTNSMTITADSTADGTADVVTSGNITNIDAITVADAGDAATGATAAGKDIEIDLTSYATALTIDASALDAGTADADADGKFGDDTDAEQLIITGTSAKALTVTGGDADDTIIGSSDGAAGDTLKGGAGEDTLTMAGNLTYKDTIDGGAGDDTMSLDSSTAIGDVAFMNVSNVESITMSDTTADLTLGAYASAAKIAKVTVHAGNGNDVVDASGMTTSVEIVGSTTTAGDDTLTGGTANDTFTFSGTAALEDSDKIVGGDGTDTISINNSAGAVTVGTDTSNGLKVSDTAGAGVISGVEQFVVKDADGGDTAGSEDADLIKVFFGDTSSAAAYNTIVDGSVLTDANDAMTVDASSVTDAKFNTTFTVTGGAGKDTLIGGDGADTLSGGENDDTITGGVGADTLTGGAGADDFIYALGSSESTNTKTDTITDFVTASDEIRISFTAANSTYDFTNKGTAASASDAMSLMSSVAGQFYLDTASNEVVLDTDGNGLLQAADFAVKLSGVSAIGAADVAFDVTSGSGTNTITTHGGADTIILGYVGDSVTSGAGDDTISIGNLDFSGTLAFGTGTADTLKVTHAGADVIDGTVTGLEKITIGENFEVDLSVAQLATLNAVDGAAITGVSGNAVETIKVTGANSTTNTIVASGIEFTNASAILLGGDGADTITGGTGNDYITGNAGDDADVLTGGAGNDTYAIADETGVDVYVELSGGGTDTILFLDSESLVGDKFGTAADTATANAALAHIEQIVVDTDATSTFSSAQLSGQTIGINALAAGTAYIDVDATNASTANTIDLGNLTVTAFTFVNDDGELDTGVAFDASDSAVIDGGSAVDTITAMDTVINTINAHGGADIITLGSGADVVKYDAVDDGGTTGDVVTSFTSGSDHISIKNALTTDATTAGAAVIKAAASADTATAVTLAAADVLFVGKTANTNAVDGSSNALSVTKANLGDKTKIAALVDDQFDITASAGDDLSVLIVESSDDAGEFGVYHWTPASTSDAAIAGGELTILGIYSGDALNTATDILIH